MRIVFDSGSTKVAAALINTLSGTIDVLELPTGYNALSAYDGELTKLIGDVKLLSDVSPDIHNIYYYGAGCATPDACARVKKELGVSFPSAKVSIDSDMLGAARAVCGDNPGIVGILGTGSNSCLYDGRNIIGNVPPLGYILGDEGSGAVLGRLFLGMLFKGRFPAQLREEFDEKYHFGVADIITRVYRQPAANAFLASFAPFIAVSAKKYPEVEKFLDDEFTRYVLNNLTGYDGFDRLPIHFVGSIALNFSEYLARALARHGGHLGTVICAPIHNLAHYHAEWITPVKSKKNL